MQNEMRNDCAEKGAMKVATNGEMKCAKKSATKDVMKGATKC